MSVNDYERGEYYGPESSEAQVEELGDVQAFRKAVMDAWLALCAKPVDGNILMRLDEGFYGFLESYVDDEISMLEADIERIEQANAEDENREHRTY